jgi:short subunit dehydrogenase-like uncharacterized protein
MVSSLQVAICKILNTFIFPPQITFHAVSASSTLAVFDQDKQQIKSTTLRVKLVNRFVTVSGQTKSEHHKQKGSTAFHHTAKTFPIHTTHLTGIHARCYLLPSCMRGPCSVYMNHMEMLQLTDKRRN